MAADDPYDVEPMNSDEYPDLARERRKLTDGQIALLHRLADALEATRGRKFASHTITLERNEVASAGGLERRGFVGTSRARTSSVLASRPRYSGPRTCWLTDKGRALVLLLPPRAPQPRISEIRITLRPGDYTAQALTQGGDVEHDVSSPRLEEVESHVRKWRAQMERKK